MIVIIIDEKQYPLHNKGSKKRMWGHIFEIYHIFFRRKESASAETLSSVFL